MGFFEERSIASQVKHQLLTRYLPVFAMKTSVAMADRRAFYIDGYAGPGMYDDLSPGSPLVAAEVAEALAGTSVEVRNRIRCELIGVFIEEHAASAARLRANLAAVGRVDWTVLEGRSVDRLSDAIALADRAPLLVFLDPYGLGIPFDMLIDEVLARANVATTEVLLNFSRSALSRLGGFLDRHWGDDTSQSQQDIRKFERQRDMLLDRLDAFLGGHWWREVKRQYGDMWRDVAREQFVALLNERTDGRWRSYCAAVPQRWGGPAVYDLLLLSRHPHGPWKFNEATARTFRDLYEATWAQPDTLFASGDAIPDPRPEYVSNIKANVIAGLRSDGPFTVAERMNLVFCDGTRGLAGPPEVLKALRALHDAGLIDGEYPKSKGLEDYVVTPGPQFE